MLVRALKTFNGRYGKINKGQMFNAEPGYVQDLNKRKANPLVEVLEKSDQPAPGPSQDRSRGDAPRRSGKDQGQAQPGPAPADTGAQSDSGKAITSASLPVAPASRKTTSRPLAVGGRRGKPTPRKGKSSAKAKTASTPPADA
jgi:hypothetical protein